MFIENLSKQRSSCRTVLNRLNAPHNIDRNVKFPSFLTRLLISYSAIIIICICIMTILSYKYVGDNIRERAIRSNNNLLNQFRNTTDSLILGNINELSLKMLQDAQTIPSISYYLSHPLDNHVVDTLQVNKYLSNMKTVNPMLYSLGYYFDRNNLLISTEAIKHTLYEDIQAQKILKYYYDLINSTDGINKSSWYVDHNYGINKYKHETDIVNNIIHMIRIIPGNSNSGKRDGAIIVSIKEDVFYNIIKKAAGDELDEIIIIDDDGVIVSHTDKEALGHNILDFPYGKKIMASKNLGNHSISYFITSVNGVSSVVSYCVSSYTDWRYMTITPMEKYTGATSFFTRLIVIIALLTVIIGVFLSAISASKFNIPLKKLVSFCKGVLNTPESKEGNEYTIIHSTISNLTDKIKEQEERFTESIPVLKTNFVHNLISGNSYNMQDMKDKMALLNIEFSYSRFCVAIIKTKKLNPSDDIGDIKRYEYERVSLLSYIENLLNTNYSSCLYCEKEDNLVVVINFETGEKKMFGLINTLSEYECRSTPLKLCAALGKSVNSISFIHDSYHSAISAIKYYFIYPEKSILTFREFASREERSIYTDSFLLRDFSDNIKSLNRERALSSLEKIITELRNNNYSLDDVNKTMLKCITVVEDAVAHFGINPDSIGYNSKDAANQLRNNDSILEAKDWLLNTINSILDHLESKQSDKNKEIVAKAQKLIQKNIQDYQLSLSTVAEALGVSQSHLSRIFKNEAGSTFIDYVTSLKLEYCRDLLLTTDLKIEDISSVMGYSTSQYFINRFKKKYGYTPNEYRLKNNINIGNLTTQIGCNYET